VKLVTTPNRRGHLGEDLEEVAGDARIVTQLLGTIDCLVNVRDDAIAPAADLVAEEAEGASHTTADWSFGHDTTDMPVRASGCLLDHESPIRDPDLKRRVVKVLPFPSLEPRRDGLEDLAV
jgi:hypothetical protein